VYQSEEKTVTAQFKPRRRSAKTPIAPLVIGALGSAGVVALYFLVPGVQYIELALLLVVVGFGAVGCRQGIVRGVMSAAMLYIATGAAATLYPLPAPYVGAARRILGLLFSGDAFTGDPGASISQNVTRDSLALSFGLLMVVIWVALEALARASFRDTRLPSLGILDNVSGFIVYLAIGVLVASLWFNAIGYGRLRRVHNEALFRPRFNQVLYAHYTTQSFWFPEEPPPIYAYDLDLSRER
jgi:hypothetical protein